MKTEALDKKIIIDLNAEKVVDFKGKLGISDLFTLLEVLTNLLKTIEEHIQKNIMVSYINLASKIKLECEMSDSDDGEIKISNEKFIKIIEEIMK